MMLVDHVDVDAEPILTDVVDDDAAEVEAESARNSWVGRGIPGAAAAILPLGTCLKRQNQLAPKGEARDRFHSMDTRTSSHPWSL